MNSPQLTPDPPSDDKQPEENSLGFWSVFFSTFLTILLAELGDKTQVTILLMSAKFQDPWVIFVGASLALIGTSLLGVLAGRWLFSRINPAILHRLAGVILLAIAGVLFWDAFSGIVG